MEYELWQLGGIRITEERELYVLHERLQRYPQAVNAILQPATNLNGPVDALRPSEVSLLA
jgi:hypothetical protein